MNRRFKSMMNGVKLWGVPVLIVVLLMAALVGIVYQFVESGPLDTSIEQDLEEAQRTEGIAATPPTHDQGSGSSAAGGSGAGQ